jgi:hypothetical protein
MSRRHRNPQQIVDMRMRRGTFDMLFYLECLLTLGRQLSCILINYCCQEKRIVIFELCAFVTFFLAAANASGAGNAETNLVAFFKQVIASPPDIERFVAKRTALQVPIEGSAGSNSFQFQYFEGALSGTNYYLHSIRDPALPADTNRLGIIAARSGSSSYGIGGDGIIYAIGENMAVENVKANFVLSRQILCMGVGALEPDTVKWVGNEFTARNVVGKEVHGSLQISNNIPFRMEVGLVGEALPYMEIVYTYATPEDSFSGYPQNFLISYRFNQGLMKPLAKVEFQSVLLAKQPLSATFFNEDRFRRFLVYTNVYSNSDYYGTDVSNRLVKIDVILPSKWSVD